MFFYERFNSDDIIGFLGELFMYVLLFSWQRNLIEIIENDSILRLKLGGYIFTRIVCLFFFY